jgi:GNAT superfamily N-acetyltransferase
MPRVEHRIGEAIASMQLTITVESEPDPATAVRIADGLNAFNIAAVGPRDAQPLWLIARDREGTVQAGLKGRTLWSWLYVEWLWVAESFRRSGLGLRVLRQAEQIASERDCVGAYLYTYSFQAPAFYVRHGYAEFGRLEGMPPGMATIFLRKDLRSSKDPATRGA